MKHWRPEKRKFFCLKRSQKSRKEALRLKLQNTGQLDREYIPLQGMETFKEALETRTKERCLVRSLETRKIKLQCVERSLETRKGKLWCLKRSQGVWKGGHETKAVEYGRIDRHYIPLEGMETRKEALETRKGNPGDQKEALDTRKRKLLCLKKSQKSGKEALKLKPQNTGEQTDIISLWKEWRLEMKL